MDKTAILVLSGGQDSTTCGFLAKDMGYAMHAITFDYGQRHASEIEAARVIARRLGCLSHEIIRLPCDVLRSASPLVNAASELEQYPSHAELPDGIEKTFVPLRNQLFFTIAANRAAHHGANVVVTGVCQEDNNGYPDCRSGYVREVQLATNLGMAGTGIKLDFDAPLMYLDKKDIVKLGLRLPGCYPALAHTQTGYDGAYPPTGHDHATLLRAKGFEEAGVPDPLVVRAWMDRAMELPDAPNYRAKLLAASVNAIKGDTDFIFPGDL